MNALQIVEAETAKAARKAFRENRWGERHVKAWADALLFATSDSRHRCTAEDGLTLLVVGLAKWATDYRERYSGRVGDDGVLGDHWQAIAEGILGLLNGECGRLDAGTLDGILRRCLEAEGFTDDDPRLTSNAVVDRPKQ